MYYNENSILYLNGQFLKAADTKCDFFSQTLHYGYGVFEGIRSYHTNLGTRIFKEVEHYNRLLKSAELINIPVKHKTEELVQATYQLLDLNGLSNAYIRPLVFCDPNMALTEPLGANLMICAWKWDKYFNDQLLNICISSFQRPNPKSVKMEAKVTGYYINSILATNEAKARGFDEALLLDMNGNVAEAPGANFFYEKDGKLFTPPNSHIFPGITRQTVMSICKQLDIPVYEEYFTPDVLEDADGAFYCGTAAEIAGIGSINARQMNKSWEESVGALIQQAYRLQVLEKSIQGVFI